MPGGDAFDERQQHELDRAVDAANSRSDLHFSVYIGRAEGDFATYAERLLGSLADPARAVLLVVDPEARRLEIVTGRDAAARLDDGACGLAALSMSSSFTGGDLVGGIVTGLRMLGDSVAV